MAPLGPMLLPLTEIGMHKCDEGHLSRISMIRQMGIEWAFENSLRGVIHSQGVDSRFILKSRPFLFLCLSLM